MMCSVLKHKLSWIYLFLFLLFRYESQRDFKCKWKQWLIIKEQYLNLLTNMEIYLLICFYLFNKIKWLKSVNAK